jgi:hypothetical protein
VGLLGGLLGGLLVGAFLDRFDHPAYVPGKLTLSIIWGIVGIFAGVACYTRRTWKCWQTRPVVARYGANPRSKNFAALRHRMFSLSAGEIARSLTISTCSFGSIGTGP